MIYYFLLILFGTYFFATWLNAKFIRDSAHKDGYWHIVQFYGWIWTYFSYGLIPIIFGMPLLYWLFNVGLVLISFGLMYMLMYNSLLNLMRKFKITHLGRYDFLSFPMTVILFMFGLSLLIFLLTR